MTVIAARALAAAIEPFAGQVFFSPECHRAYQALGFGPSPGRLENVAMPDVSAYFCSRGAMLGQVPGTVIAAAFAVFNPAVVVPAVDYGWSLTDAATVWEARTGGAVGQLHRILGAAPDGLGRAVELLRAAADGLPLHGKPVFAGLVARGLPGDALADAWRLAERLREYRGDAHVNAWTSAGFTPVEIGLLTELYQGRPLRSHIRIMGWGDDDLDAGEQALASRGLIRDGALTDAGRAGSEAVEAATDDACAPILTGLDDGLGELVDIVGRWSHRVLSAGGFPGG